MHNSRALDAVHATDGGVRSSLSFSCVVYYVRLLFVDAAFITFSRAPSISLAQNLNVVLVRKRSELSLNACCASYELRTVFKHITGFTERSRHFFKGQLDFITEVITMKTDNLI